MWSSQRYRQEGIAKGLESQLIEDAIDQTEQVLSTGLELPSILSLNHLSERTGVGYEFLRSFVSRSPLPGVEHCEPYHKFSIRKRSGGRRFIHVPHPKLLYVQRWINLHILKKVPVHSASQAFNGGCSIRKCAVKHCGSAWLIKVDVADFFDSVSEIQVYRIFRELGYQPLVAFELARLSTVATFWMSPRKRYPHWHSNSVNSEIEPYSQRLLGYLPQGAPTSPLLSNLVMRKPDAQLSSLAQDYGLVFTRYSDDLCFSSKDTGFGRKRSREVIFESYKILSQAGYRPRHRKTTIVPPGGKKVVLGLNVDQAMPRLQKSFKDRVRQHLYYLEKLGPIEHASARKFDSVWGLKSHVKGLIDFAKIIEPSYAMTCLNRFKSVDWPV